MKQQNLLALALSVALLSSTMAMPAANAARQVYKAGTLYSRQFRAADSALQTGRFDTAEAQYTAALKRSPSNLAARAGLSMAQAELYKLDAAEKNADQVLAKDSKNAMAHMAKGVVYRNRTASQDMEYRNNREVLLRQSEEELKEALRYAGNSPEVYDQLGTTYRFMGRNDEARQAFEKALDLDPRFAEAKLNLGIMQMQSGDTAGAKYQFGEAIKLNSKNYMAHFRMGEALLAEGDAHGALKSLNTALALNPGNASIMAKQGDAYEAQGNTAAAVASYRKAIQSNPTYMPAYMGISDIFDNRGDGELAMAELRSALNANPNWSTGRNRLGRLALTVDKPDQALQYYREALKQNPQDSDAINGMSQALTVIAQKQANWSSTLGADSDLMNAEYSINEALRLNPNDMRLHLANLRISQLAGKPAMSEAELHTLAGIQPRNEAEAMMQGEAFLALGRYEQADQVFGGLMRQAGNDADKLLIIGDTLKTNGDLLRAKDAYQMALAANPGNMKAQRGIARIAKAKDESERSLRNAKAVNSFWKRSGKESAIDFYEDALSKNPRQPEARLELSKLYERTQQYDKAARSYQFYVGLRSDLTTDERDDYQRKISHLQELATREAQKPTASEQQPLPSTMMPMAGQTPYMPPQQTSQGATAPQALPRINP